WRMIYAAIAVLAVAIAVTIRLLLPADEPAPVMAQGTATSPWREPRLVGPATLAVVALFFVFSHFVVYTYATVFFTFDGCADPLLGTYIAVIGVASILGLIVYG